MLEILETVSTVVVALGLLAFGVIFLAAFLEGVVGIGILVPGSTLMVLFGVVTAHQDANIMAVILWAGFGATCGDHFSYYLGRHFGAAWLTSKKWPFSIVDLELGQQYFRKHGAHSVFLASFVPVVNKVIPFTAGSLSMDKKTFFVYNVLGSIGWATLWGGIGYLLGHSLHLIEKWVGRVEMVLLGIVVVYGLFLLYRYIIFRTTRS